MMQPNFCDVFLSKNNIDLFHYRYQQQVIDINKYKNKVIVTGIIVGIFTFGIGGYLTARLLSAHYKLKALNAMEKKQFVVAKANQQFKKITENNPESQNIIQKFIPEKPSTNPVNILPANLEPKIEKRQNEIVLEKTSGIPNAELGCFINSALQSIRNIPTIWKYLDEDHPLKKSEEESDEQFKLRSDIRQQMNHLLKKCNNGEIIAENEMIEFRALLHSYNDQLPLKGFGDKGTMNHVIFSALELPKIQFKMINKKTNKQIGNDYHQMKLGIGTQQDKRISVQEALNEMKCDTIVRLPSILVLDVNHHAIKGHDHYIGDLNFTLEPDHEIEIESVEEKSVKYRLVSLMQQTSNHYIAHVRNLNSDNPPWVCFNDSHVSSNNRLDDKVKRQIICLYYERIS